MPIKMINAETQKFYLFLTRQYGQFSKILLHICPVNCELYVYTLHTVSTECIICTIWHCIYVCMSSEL